MVVTERIAGEVVKKSGPKYELLTSYTARHTFATQSLLRGMPVGGAAKGDGPRQDSNHADLREGGEGPVAPDQAANLGRSGGRKRQRGGTGMPGLLGEALGRLKIRLQRRV